MYLILVFLCTVASMGKHQAYVWIGMLNLILFITWCYFGSLVLHIFWQKYSKLIRIFLITSAAFIFSPPFCTSCGYALKKQRCYGDRDNRWNNRLYRVIIWSCSCLFSEGILKRKCLSLKSLPRGRDFMNYLICISFPLPGSGGRRG